MVVLVRIYPTRDPKENLGLSDSKSFDLSNASDLENHSMNPYRGSVLQFTT